MDQMASRLALAMTNTITVYSLYYAPVGIILGFVTGLEFLGVFLYKKKEDMLDAHFEVPSKYILSFSVS